MDLEMLTMELRRLGEKLDRQTAALEKQTAALEVIRDIGFDSVDLMKQIELRLPKLPEAVTPSAEKAPARPAAVKPAHGFEEIRGLLAKKAAGGFRDKVKDLLEAHGMGCLSDMADKPELYELLYAEADRIGA